MRLAFFLLIAIASCNAVETGSRQAIVPVVTSHPVPKPAAISREESARENGVWCTTQSALYPKGCPSDECQGIAQPWCFSGFENCEALHANGRGFRACAMPDYSANTIELMPPVADLAGELSQICFATLTYAGGTDPRVRIECSHPGAGCEIALSRFSEGPFVVSRCAPLADVVTRVVKARKHVPTSWCFEQWGQSANDCPPTPASERCFARTFISHSPSCAPSREACVAQRTAHQPRKLRGYEDGPCQMYKRKLEGNFAR